MIEEALCLHIGEVEAEAHMRAAAVGHPGILVTRADSLVRKAQGIKLERLRPDFRHAVREDDVDRNACDSRNVETFELKVAHCSAWYAGYRRIDAYCFLEGHLQEWEFAQPFVGKRRIGWKTEPFGPPACRGLAHSISGRPMSQGVSHD